MNPELDNALNAAVADFVAAVGNAVWNAERGKFINQFQAQAFLAEFGWQFASFTNLAAHTIEAFEDENGSSNHDPQFRIQEWRDRACWAAKRKLNTKCGKFGAGGG